MSFFRFSSFFWYSLSLFFMYVLVLFVTHGVLGLDESFFLWYVFVNKFSTVCFDVFHMSFTDVLCAIS